MMERSFQSNGRAAAPVVNLALVALCCCAAHHVAASANDAVAPPSLFAEPGLPAERPAELAAGASLAPDQILLISTRRLGTRCEPEVMADGLRCETLNYHARGAGEWQPVEWEALRAELAHPRPTIIYIHGNRVDPGRARAHGLAMYRSIAACKQGAAPLRFIIWSWPSSQIPGQLKDYQVKAARTKPVGWQLAWAIDQLPAETPLALVGYSYGARVATGALHLLAGGELGQLRLAQREHPQRPPVRAALVAAALDADWIRPGGYHGRALEQVDQLLLVNNHRDPAMRFYHLAMESGARPLGYGGSGRLGQFADRVRSIDVTDAVGRHHDIGEYLSSSGRVGQVLEQVVQLPAPPSPPAATGDASLAARPN